MFTLTLAGKRPQFCGLSHYGIITTGKVLLCAGEAILINIYISINVNCINAPDDPGREIFVTRNVYCDSWFTNMYVMCRLAECGILTVAVIQPDVRHHRTTIN